MAALLASMASLSSRGCIAPQPFTSVRQPARTAARPMVMAMAKGTRAADFRGLSAEEIDAQVQECKKDMFTLRIKFAKREDYKPSDMRALKKKVAQLLTVRREKELAQGVTKREAQAAEKRMLSEAGLGRF